MKRKLFTFIPSSLLFIFSIVLLMAYSPVKYKNNTSIKSSNLLILTTDENLNINYFLFSLKGGSYDKLLSLKKSTYHTGLLNKYTYTLYYTNKDDQNYTQLFSYDIKTKKDHQLTSMDNNGVSNVDYIFMNRDKTQLFIRTLKENQRNFALGTFDIDNNELKSIISTNNDTSIKLFDYYPLDNKLVLVQYSLKEQYENLEKANTSSVLEPLTYSIVISDNELSSFKSLFKLKQAISSISINSQCNKILISANDYSKKSSIIEEYGLDGTLLKTFTSDDLKVINITAAKYTADGKGFYFIASNKNEGPHKSTNGDEYIPNAIMYYDYYSKNCSVIFKPENGIINSFNIVN